MKEKKVINLKIKGLKCDNLTCNYVDNNIESEDYEKYIDKPCPKCGSNLLTKEDFALTAGLKAFANFLNDLPKDVLDNVLKTSPEKEDVIKTKYGLSQDVERVNLELDLHNGISIKKVTPVNEKE